MEGQAANLLSLLSTVKCAFLIFAITAMAAVFYVTRRCFAYKVKAAEKKVPPSELLYLSQKMMSESEDWNSTI